MLLVGVGLSLGGTQGPGPSHVTDAVVSAPCWKGSPEEALEALAPKWHFLFLLHPTEGHGHRGQLQGRMGKVIPSWVSVEERDHGPWGPAICAARGFQPTLP